MAGFTIGIFVMLAGGYFAVRASSMVLADANNDPEVLDTIKEIASEIRGIHSIDDLRVRRSVPFLFPLKCTYGLMET